MFDARLTVQLPSILRSITALIAVALSCLVAQAQQSEEQRVQRISDQLIAPCCWREPVSVHQSPEAALVRKQISSRVRLGFTDGQIVDELVRQYGKRIVRDPNGPIWFYCVPLLALIGGVVLWIGYVRRSLSADLKTKQERFGRKEAIDV